MTGMRSVCREDPRLDGLTTSGNRRNIVVPCILRRCPSHFGDVSITNVALHAWAATPSASDCGRVVTLGKIGPMAFFFVHEKCQHYYESGHARRNANDR